MLVQTFEVNEYRRKFFGYYHSKIASDLASLEQYRAPELVKYRFWQCLIGVSVIITLWALYHFYNIMPDGFWDKGGPGECIMVTGGAFCSLFYYLALRVKKNFEEMVKTEVIKSFLSFFGDFRWSFQDESISESEMEFSKLVGTITKSESDDYFEGTHRGEKLIISEVKLTRGTGKNETDIFKGVFIKLNMNKKFDSHTIVIEDCTFIKTCTLPGLPYKFSDMEKTELEDPEFNKMFDVFTEDEVEARYILTTSFMERLKNLKEVYKAKDIRASFLDNTVLIALSCKKDMFIMGDVTKPVSDSGEMQTMFEEFAAILAIIDLLKLDVKTGL